MSLENIIATRSVEVGPAYTIFGTPMTIILTVLPRNVAGVLVEDSELAPLWLELLSARAGARSEEAGESAIIDLAVTDSLGEEEPPTHTYTLVVRTLAEGSTDVYRAQKYMLRNVEVPTDNDPLLIDLSKFEVV